MISDHSEVSSVSSRESRNPFTYFRTSYERDRFRGLCIFSFILRGRKPHSHAQSGFVSWPLSIFVAFLSKKAKAKARGKPVGFFYRHVRISYTAKCGLVTATQRPKMAVSANGKLKLTVGFCLPRTGFLILLRRSRFVGKQIQFGI